MLAKRIIACLDVNNGMVVKGIKFNNHVIVGNILELAKYYSQEGIDELVFYDISASPRKKLLDIQWIARIADIINIPFSVAGGISSVEDARLILSLGADKISINSPALHNPSLISQLADRFGVQCIVVGIDSWYDKNSKKYHVFQYTGQQSKSCSTLWNTIDWVQKVQKLGAGEIVLNTMNTDGMKNGYDIIQLQRIRDICSIPLIASGGAGNMYDFLNVFNYAHVDGALAASIFHDKTVSIIDLKNFLSDKGVIIRKC
ncbi:imidazole glycerol phosphate synthase subunit HisF [Buchnera aphidicola]|uniref:Imidazole glycerol phosphate synthase subunit HisF n=1 Tax=Buchnera aphidicola (Cinara cf. splendens/pseudotsugae 3390) TaxID=2518980 RepID=A0A451CX10_9GAMM|nr:imidazole glycerol phosphate synthase subunit HisF [Buchnera aphidicola]VFP77646.1 Imidazole glycerol phosphate synthase subunit HisF [Buchnera aphidicola (Cinara cf. splendens/pseudotsugae 3390)]